MISLYERQLTVDQAPHSASQFVGRQRELALIWSQYEAAKTGCGGVTFLVGELGIGKTCMLDEFARRATRDGAVVLQGGASEADGMPPYLPFLEALGKYIRMTSPDHLRTQVAHVPHTLSSILPELAVYVDDLSMPYPLPPEQARLRLYEAIGIFLENISASQVLVLTLDDLHWADSASLDLLCYIVRHQAKAKLLILGAYRESEIDRNSALGRTLIDLVRQRALTAVTVDPFSSEEIEALAVNYLGSPTSPDVSSLLYTQSEGNPFFAEELLRGWIEAKILVRENEQWVAVASLECTLPSSIIGALRQRFALLSSDVINHLRIAAVIGRMFDLSLLATVEEQEIETVEERLLEAEHARLIRSDLEGGFTFSHDKIRACLYAEVSTSRRRRLHEAIGRILEARYEQESTKSTCLLAAIAFHFTHSGDTVRAVTYAHQAAEQALRSFAVEEARSYYRMALDHLDPGDKRRGDLLLGLGESALLASVEDEAIAAYEGALAWFSQSGGLETAVRASHGLGLAQWQRRELPAAKTAFEHALVLLEKPSAEKARVLIHLATLLIIYMGQQAEGIIHAERALEIARQLENSRLEAAASRVLAGKLYSPGNEVSIALPKLEQALLLAISVDDPSEAAESCFYIAFAYYCMGEVKHSYETSVRRIEFIERSRQSYLLQNAHSWLALLLSSQGEWAEAEQTIERAQSIVAHVSSPFPRAFLHQIRGFLAFQQENYVTAEYEFQEARAKWQRNPGELMLFTGLIGMTQAARGKREEAFASIIELETLLEKLPAGTIPTAPIMLCLALTAITLDDLEWATSLYPKLLAFRGQHYWFLVDRVLGEICTARGDWDMAMMHLREAEATARLEELRPELARTMLAQAKCEMTHGSPESVAHATSILKSALTLSESLHMTDTAEHVRSWLYTISHRAYDATLKASPANLTRSEARVLQLVVKGRRNREIAQELCISEKTVANHLSHIFNKTTSENRAAATAFAIRHGLA
jgi:predicted ATPase